MHNILVMVQDMPAMYWEDPFSQGESYRAAAEKVQFEHELTRMIEVSQYLCLCRTNQLLTTSSIHAC